MTAACMLGLFAASTLAGADKPAAKPDPPRLMMAWPWVVEASGKSEVMLRGSGFSATTQVGLSRTREGKSKGTPLKVLEKPKDFPLPDGMDAKANGNQVLRVELEADGTPGEALLQVEGDGGKRSLLPLEITRTKLTRDKEPNNDLNLAQSINLGTTPAPARILGTIEKPLDCDCFRLEVPRGRKLRVQVIARRKGSLLDPILTIQEPDGTLWKTSGPPPQAEDLVVVTTAPKTGPVCLVVRDAFDSGGTLHGYELSAELLP